MKLIGDGAMPKHKTMRITGGSLVRHRFLIPKQVDEGLVRPTPDRVREAVFSMIIHDIPNAIVLDLFAGSGAHGFEAISRGAKIVHFVESNKEVAALIKENIQNLGLGDVCVVQVNDAERMISNAPKELADIIFVDPPYSHKLKSDFFSLLVRHLSENGLVIFRCFKKETPSFGEKLYVDRDRKYGNTKVFILRRALT
jgi:16S rRNA (guanine966-N2)-methyltransferase